MRAGQRDICTQNGSVTAALASNCQVYDSPVEYKPLEFKEWTPETGGERIVGAFERVIIKFKHILFNSGGGHESGDLQGFVVPNISDKEDHNDHN